MNLKIWWQKSSSSRVAVRSNTSLILALWINDRPCTHQSLGAVPSLLIPISKSYSLVKKKKDKLTKISIGIMEI